MDTADQLEALLDAATNTLCPDLHSWDPVTGEVLPAQYLLLTRDLPRARARLRRAAEALLTLLDVADAAYATDDDGCAKFRALAAAPAWLLRPACPEDTDLDMALAWECAVDHSGDWHRLLEALHRAGSVKWQPAIRRCRALMRFEAETGLDLAQVVGGSTSDQKRIDEKETVYG
jgi:hypothetical protein